MKKLFFVLMTTLALVSCSESFNAARLLQGGAKAAQAASISNEQMQAYIAQSVAQLDAQATVLPSTNSYCQRLARITKGLNSVNGIPLNFKVYKTNEINAFACADGSVRVYSGLMDLMSDYEVLGVIGHEIGHVALEHTLKAYKNALLTSAMLDAVASTGDVAAVLSDSILGQLGASMVSAKFSRKQETAADDFSYDFMKGAGLNPMYLATAFEKLLGASEGGSATSSRVAEMFSSHPDTKARIERVTTKATADGFARPKQ